MEEKTRWRLKEQRREKRERDEMERGRRKRRKEEEHRGSKRSGETPERRQFQTRMKNFPLKGKFGIMGRRWKSTK